MGYKLSTPGVGYFFNLLPYPPGEKPRGSRMEMSTAEAGRRPATEAVNLPCERFAPAAAA